MNMTGAKPWLFIVAALAQAACSGDDDAPPLAGPCVHMYQDEVLHIEAASGRDTGAVIPTLELRDFHLDAAAMSLDNVMASRTRQLQRDGEVLRCTLPCSWGIFEGEWSFSARAPGYEWTDQAAEAAYAVNVGGCPSYSDQGHRIAIELAESAGG